ncbi:hypothetical protein NDU88_000433, partial [Pleurodeles waltl]
PPPPPGTPSGAWICVSLAGAPKPSILGYHLRPAPIPGILGNHLRLYRNCRGASKVGGLFYHPGDTGPLPTCPVLTATP